jgi:hypothetical protein
MPGRSVRAAAAAILQALGDGLEADDSALHFILSTHGDASAAAIREALRDRDDPDAATLAGLLLFPGGKVLARLEPVLERAACSPDDAAEAARIVEAEARFARVSLPGGESRKAAPGRDHGGSVIGSGGERVEGATAPDGERLEIALEPGDAVSFVARLRLTANPPRELAAIIDERFPADTAITLKVLLRHCRLAFTPMRRAFLAGLLAGLNDGRKLDAQASSGAIGQIRDAQAPAGNVHAVLSWTVSWLSVLPPDAAPLDRLGDKYHELSARLKRALDYHEMLAKSSFEVMLSQGVREPCMHPESILAELALLDAVSLAVTGRPAWTLAGLMEDDLGAMSDPEDVIRALGGV